MRWQGKDSDRVTVEEAKAFFEKVKLTFPGCDCAMGAPR